MLGVSFVHIMRKTIILITILSIALTSVVAQDSVRIIQHTDTFKLAEQKAIAADDALLLQLLHRQSQTLAQREDSIHQWRLQTDTTYMVHLSGSVHADSTYLHVGYGDSIRMADHVKRNPYHPLAMPLYLVKKPLRSLSDTLPEPFDIYTIRQDARTYLANHHAELYVDLYDSIDYVGPTELPTLPAQTLMLETKALVYDEEEARKDRMRALREQYSPWRKDATIMLQLTQNYVSKNWYAGGNSNFAILGLVKGNLIYDNKKNITWENAAEWRMGFNTVEGDSLRKVNTNEDIFKIYSKLGIKAFGKFSYSASADFQTHFFNTWKENTEEIKTGPITPIRLNIALGLDYKPIDGLSIVLSPVNYKMVYANDTIRVPKSSFGIEEGKTTLNEIGSSFRVDWKWRPVREISLDTKFYCYTNYKRVELDLEIACDFIINRYFSARLMLHPRYDNTVILPDDEKAKIQFKELLSIGFAHKFR